MLALEAWAVVDDIVQASFTLYGLQDTVCVCEEYSRLRRFRITLLKSRSLQCYGQRHKIALTLPVDCRKMHGSDIEVVESCTDIGITVHARHSAGDCVEQAANKWRRSFISDLVANCAIRISDIGSIAAAKIYKCSVLASFQPSVVF